MTQINHGNKIHGQIEQNLQNSGYATKKDEEIKSHGTYV